MDSVATTKTCTKCGEVKPLSGYAPRVGRPLGVQSQCRDCQAKAKRRYYQDNRESIRAKAKQEWASDAQVKDRARQYRLANLEKYAAWQRQWRESNPEKVAALNAQRRAATAAKPKSDRVPFDAKAYRRKWYQDNKNRVRAYRQDHANRRRARLRNAGAFRVTRKDLRRLLATGCSVIGCASTDLHLDHIIPIARGGRHSVGNLQALCATHNRMKHTKTWMEFRIYLRRKASP